MRVKVKYPYGTLREKVVVEKIVEISLWEFLKCRVFGQPVFLFSGKLSPDWLGELPIFLIFCPNHKFTLTYSQGFDEHKNCLLCLIEQESKLREALFVK